MADAVTELSIPWTGMEYTENASFTSTNQTGSNTKTDHTYDQDRDCIELLVKMNFAAVAIPLARLNCRPIQFCLSRRTNDLNLTDSRMSLSKKLETHCAGGTRL